MILIDRMSLKINIKISKTTLVTKEEGLSRLKGRLNAERNGGSRKIHIFWGDSECRYSSKGRGDVKSIERN